MGNEDKGYSAGSVILSFFIGSLIGAGLAVLLTPTSGRETREKIKQWSDTTKDRVTDLSGGLKEKASHFVEHGKGYIDQKKQILSSAIEAGKEAMEKEREKARLASVETEKETATSAD